MSGRERMNVRMAMQFYSKSVAICFKHFFAHDKRLLRVAEFVELVNDFVDIMNTRNHNQNHFKAEVSQLNTLKKMEAEILGKKIQLSMQFLLLNIINYF